MSLFALLLFLLQGYLVQTHIHGAPAAPLQITQLSQSATPHPATPYDPASCPLCQEMLHAGAFVMPGIITLPVQLDWVVFLVSAAVHDPIAIAPTRSWQSRAPPRR